MDKSKSIRIMMLIQGMKTGGLEKMVVGLVNNLPSRYERFIICFDDLGPLSGTVKKDVAVDLVKRKAGLDIEFIFKLNKLLRKYNIDILHAHNNTALFYGRLASLMARTPVFVYTEHGRTQPLSRKAVIANRIFNKTRFHTIIVSEYLRNYLVSKEGFYSKRISFVPNGISEIKVKDNIVDLRMQFRIPEGYKLVGCVGRLDPIKNHALILKAFEIVCNKISNVRLVIAGDGPMMNEIIEKIESSESLINSVQLLGERKDVENILACCDVFVLPSFSEGMSITLIEAMAAGVPIVATDVGGNAEILDKGSCGILVPSNNENELAEAIILMLCDRETGMTYSAKARSRYEQEYTIDKMVTRHIDLYERYL